MIQIDGPRLALSGAVTLDNHVALRDASVPWLAAGNLEVDWSAVTAVDSSALSLVFHWQREAMRGGHQLVHRHLPQALVALADLYGVKELLDATA